MDIGGLGKSFRKIVDIWCQMLWKYIEDVSLEVIKVERILLGI